jgi:hypothetical protein
MKKCDGRSKTKLYKTWVCMKRRCDNPDTHHKKYYQNIKICDEWYDFDNFKLWALNNGYKEGLTIERIDVFGNYEPSNCTWIEKEKQTINRRNKSQLIINGVSKSFTEWANEYGIRENTIRMRIKYGMSGLDLLQPTKKYGLHNPFKKEGGHH